MTAAVTIQPQGFSVQYPKTQWRVSFVEDTADKFRFMLRGQNFKFEPRDRYRYPTHDAARLAIEKFWSLRWESLLLKAYCQVQLLLN